MEYQHDSEQRPDRRGGNGSGYGMEQSRFGFGRNSSQKNKKGLLGLSNLGNTCYMNAALQCLAHTHGAQKYFRFCRHTYTSKSQSHRQKLIMAFANWFERDWGKNVTAHCHSPDDILRSVQQLNPSFQGYAQQDSQEFLRCVLDNMHEELRREVPDDLNGHLLRCFGIEPPGDASPPGGALPSQCGQSDSSSSNDGLQKSGGGTRGKLVVNSAPSTTRQFMQLCHSTEGADIGEIRLPAKTTSAQAAQQTSASKSGMDPNWPTSSKIALGSTPSETSTRDHTGSVPSEGTAGASSSSAGGASEKEDGAPSMHFSSIISELFQGRVVSMVRCLDCQRTSRTLEVMYDFSVPIPNANELGAGQNGMGSENLSAASAAAAGLQQHQMPGRGPTWTGMLGGIPGKVKGWFVDKGVDVTDCMRKYCAAEYLTGKDKFFCEHCKRKTDCEKRIAMKDLPEVLCIHIKRFRYDANWFNGTKNSRVVTVPVNRPLDVTAFVDEAPAQPVEYMLVGLIQHIGSMGGGHYIAYCRHKRKPQDWYEFDDMQVTLVSPEQVERAEPYVLFYQRIPSKGLKLDRQTFKNDQRGMQASIRKHVMNHPALPSTSGSSKLGDDHAQAASDEVREHGPALRNLYKSPPEELDMVFVTKHWYTRLTTMSQPGPLDNYEHLCPHQLLGCESAEIAAEPFLPISRSLFQALRQKYGGGPVINSLSLCTKCQTYLRAYNERKRAEFDLVSKYDTKDTGEGKGWYLVDALWVNNWKRYVRAEDATYIKDMCAPGPITNDRLFDKECPTMPRGNLRLRIDYIGVNARVWWLFMHVHGGGPAICREELDIYSAAYSPETHLYLDELRLKDANIEFIRKVSRQLVDECQGDLEVYEQRHACRADVASGGQSDVEMTSAAAGEALGLEQVTSDEMKDVEDTQEAPASREEDRDERMPQSHEHDVQFGCEKLEPGLRPNPAPQDETFRSQEVA